jgi:hypothetical protein
LTFQCEVCPRTATDYARYIIHLDLAHPVGELARIIEPSLFGIVVLNEAPASHLRIWDRWDKGGKSGPPTRSPGP